MQCNLELANVGVGEVVYCGSHETLKGKAANIAARYRRQCLFVSNGEHRFLMEFDRKVSANFSAVKIDRDIRRVADQ